MLQTLFAFVDDLQQGTPAGSFVLAMIFLSVEEIGAEIENPFGHKMNRDRLGRKKSWAMHRGARTHFVNLEAVTREIDANLAGICAERTGATREMLLKRPTSDQAIHSVCVSHFESLVRTGSSSPTRGGKHGAALLDSSEGEPPSIPGVQGLDAAAHTQLPRSPEHFKPLVVPARA